MTSDNKNKDYINHLKHTARQIAEQVTTDHLLYQGCTIRWVDEKPYAQMNYIIKTSSEFTNNKGTLGEVNMTIDLDKLQFAETETI